MTGTEGLTGAAEVFEGATRCLLACRGAEGPLAVPLAYWHDGEAFWAVAPAGSPEVAGLERDGACAVHVRSGGGAAVARGVARVLSLRDPAAVLLRAPVITGALAGLALRDPSSLVAAARQALLQQPPGPQNVAVLRVRLAGLVAVPGGPPPPGIAPPLPPVLPAEVRRGLAGARRVVVARLQAGDGPVELVPAWWDQRQVLVRASGGRPLAGSEAVAVALDPEPGPDGRAGPGLVLYGRTRAGVLEARRATYWRGHGLESVELPPARRELALPD